MQNRNLVIILGPTAIGKTNISIKLAQLLKTEIISSDSRQIFKELHIGTAVPNSQELHTVKHNLIQHKSIHDYYNASIFEQEALAILEKLFISNTNVILTGGSMLYIDSLCNGIDDIPSIDIQVRNSYIAKLKKEGIESLRMELKKIDPDYYSKVDLKNHKRILHALEIFHSSGIKYSTLLTNPKKVRDFNIIKIGLNTERKILHDRINLRVDNMIKEGLIEEARKVYPFKDLNSLNTVGYKELFAYFDEEITLEKAIELIKRNTRRYARRQLTWFNKDKETVWFEPSDYQGIIEFLQSKNIS